MKTVLFAWELGSGFADGAPLAALANAMVEESAGGGDAITPVFAFRDPIFGRRILTERQFPVLPVPHLQHLIPFEQHAGSYAELLAMIGFGKSEDLGLAVAAWDDLFGLVKPDLIIVEHSPTAILAAHDAIPVVVMGNGFTVPPSEPEFFPALRGNLPPSLSQNVMLEVINGLNKSRSRPEIKRLPELLKCSARAIFALPQTDPYEGIRQDPMLGTYQADLQPMAAPVEPSIFYCGPSSHPDIDEISWALFGASMPVTCVLSGQSSVAAAILKDGGATVHAVPEKMADRLEQASLVISHGQSGVVQAALRVGRPQIIMPVDLETLLTGAKIAATGAGALMEDQVQGNRQVQTKQRLSEEIADAVADVNMTNAAQSVASQIDRRGYSKDPMHQLVKICSNLL